MAKSLKEPKPEPPEGSVRVVLTYPGLRSEGFIGKKAAEMLGTLFLMLPDNPDEQEDFLSGCVRSLMKGD